jgi:AraC-like DNA-binding protein
VNWLANIDVRGEHGPALGTELDYERNGARGDTTAYFLPNDSGTDEIADRMGYSDPAAFTRAFQSWTGESPSRWRARARGGDDGGR